MYERTLRYTTLLLLAAAVLGCKGDSPTGQEQEQETLVEVTVTGDMEASHSSESAFFRDDANPDTGEPQWVVLLSADAGTDSGIFLFFIHQGQRPGEGTLDLGGPGERTAAGLEVQVGDVGGAFSSTSGTLEVTGSSSDFVSGTFEFTAEGVIVEGEELTEGNITVSGQFRARSDQP